MTNGNNSDLHCTENDTTYNGWKNRETWALNLWFNNDEGLYLEMRGFIKDLKEQGATKETAIIALEDYFEAWVDEQVEKIDNPVIKDMIAFDVDYHEVAVANLEDYEEVE